MVVDGREYDFHLLPSGIINTKAVSFIGECQQPGVRRASAGRAWGDVQPRGLPHVGLAVAGELGWPMGLSWEPPAWARGREGGRPHGAACASLFARVRVSVCGCGT